MFNKIIDKLEKTVIAHEIRRIKPNTIRYYRPDGKMYVDKDTFFKSQSRYFYDENGNEVGYVHVRKGKVSSCARNEYDEEGKLKKVYRRNFTVINNVRVLKNECVIIYNPDKSYTIIDNGVKVVYPADTRTEVKDERGNVIHSSVIYPDEERGSYYTNSTFDENNNRLSHEYVVSVHNNITELHREFNEYDSKNRCIKHVFYMKHENRSDESVSLTYYTYDDKNRVIYEREYHNFYHSHTGNQNYVSDSYRQYDEENNAEIHYDDHRIWDYKTYYKTTILPDGRKIEQRWVLPTWIDKVRKFFNAF